MAGLAGLVSVLLGIMMLASAPAAAGPPTYSAPGAGVFDPVANTTTFTFTFGNQDISELRFEPCSAATFVSGSGPSGPPPAVVQTSSSGGSGTTGMEFHPAPVGSYTLVYQGQVAALELFANPGPGQTQLEVGFAGCTFPPTTTTTTAAPTTTTTVAPTTTTTAAPATTTTTAGLTSAAVSPEDSTTTTAAVQVLGATVARAAPAAQPALPFTGGAHTVMLFAFGLLLLVMGMTLVQGSRHQLALAAVRTARPLASPARQQERTPAVRSGAAVTALCLLGIAALLDRHARRP
ncbi:MAG TPA: hypothetical protein VFA94_15915 [Acidimicrobiales bacterium]|nr:hypothetical protein [Acidimicrobiales bacterium]